MAILTAADIATYAPGVDLTGSTLTGAIQRAQIVAEGPLGANRKLELLRWAEVKRLLRTTQTARFTYWPVLFASDGVANDPVVEARRGNGVDNFGRSYGVLDWTLLPTDQYLIDQETGTVNLIRGQSDNFWPYNRTVLDRSKVNVLERIQFSRNSNAGHYQH